MPLKPNTKRKGLGLLNAVSIGAALMLAMPIACGDDEDDGSGGRGGRGGTGGRGGSGGKAGDASAGTGGVSGSSGNAGTGGSAGTGGADGGGDGSAGTGGSAGDSGTDAGDGGLPACANPVSASTSRLCLHLRPETITPQATPDLDGRGQLFVFVYGNAAGTGAPLAVVPYPPPVDGGLPNEVDVDELPMVPVEFNTPAAPAMVYVYAVFADNMAWHANRAGLTYGLFVGGLALAEGVQPRPPLNGITVTAGQGKAQPMILTALRKLETRVFRQPGLTIPGNGEGPLALGVFRDDDPRAAIAYGGARPGCINSNLYVRSTSDAAPPNPGFPVNAFFFGSGDFWVGAQVDDYNLGNNPSSGALVSVVLNDAGAQRLPPFQKIAVGATSYSASLPAVILTGTVPDAPATDTFSCPAPDGGS